MAQPELTVIDLTESRRKAKAILSLAKELNASLADTEERLVALEARLAEHGISLEVS